MNTSLEWRRAIAQGHLQAYVPLHIHCPTLRPFPPTHLARTCASVQREEWQAASPALPAGSLKCSWWPPSAPLPTTNCR